jgi:hypothetical protein
VVEMNVGGDLFNSDPFIGMEFQDFPVQESQGLFIFFNQDKIEAWGDVVYTGPQPPSRENDEGGQKNSKPKDLPLAAGPSSVIISQ